MNTRLMHWSAACAAVLLPVVAEAHPGHGAGMSFAAGVLHPLAGLDHLMALAATGMLAGRLGGRTGFMLMIAFEAMLALGAFCGLQGIDIPGTEGVILASVVVVGLLALAPPRRLPIASATLAAAFAFFHGDAHGSEAIAGSAPPAYVLGILLSSLAVLCASALLGALPARRARARIDQAR